ncbi:MAG: hypothetical protein QOG52_1192 [Frankiaceae bacterium]|jgi:hypothetical protein|nr:hypothetical protein [Frankiaceae bacterium]
MRVYVAVFGTFWCGAVLVGFVGGLVHKSAVAVVPGVMLAFGSTVTYRLFRVSAIVEGDSLTVRNQFTTKKLTRSDIEEFRVGRASNQPFGQAIHILIRDKSILAIDASARPCLTRRGKLLLAHKRANLETWLSHA